MQHNAKVTRVIDGDTFVATVDLEFKISLEITVRLFGVDTWEKTGKEKEKGMEAEAFLKGMIEEKEVSVFPLKKDSFGRWLAIVYFNGENLSEVMKKYSKAVIQE